MSCCHSITLPLRYLGSIDLYARMLAADRVYIDPAARFNKRDKATHRTTIADANGIINLTVPIVKPASILNALTADIRISPHDRWWDIHFTALASAYGRTPYFEFYADDFRRFYSESWVDCRLLDYDLELDTLVRRLLAIPTEVVVATPPEDVAMPSLAPLPQVEYYQVRSARQGFLPHLSIADLLFNMGPEAILILERMAGSITP